MSSCKWCFTYGVQFVSLLKACWAYIQKRLSWSTGEILFMRVCLQGSRRCAKVPEGAMWGQTHWGCWFLLGRGCHTLPCTEISRDQSRSVRLWWISEFLQSWCDYTVNQWTILFAVQGLSVTEKTGMSWRFRLCSSLGRKMKSFLLIRFEVVHL